MDYELKIELQALEDLERFLENADYQQAAVRHIGKIFYQTRVLKKFPKLRAKVFAHAGLTTAYKKWAHPFWIIYTIHETKRTIQIMEYRHYAKRPLNAADEDLSESFP